MAYVHTRVIFLCLLWFAVFSVQADLNTTQSLTDSETLLSSNAVFKLGFFSPVNSLNRYVGIWYSNVGSDGKREVVWVANRENPLSDFSGVLKISRDGNLRVLNGRNTSFWSSNVSSDEPNTWVCQLLDNGNLVLRSNENGKTLWQSFDHPTDVFLPEMSFTIDSTLNQKQALFRSWKSPADPSGGNFTVGIETRVPPEVLLWSGNQPDWRNGPWNGNLFVGVNSVLSIVTNAGKVYFGFSLANQLSGLLHFVVSYDGSLVERSWDVDSRKWVTVWNSRSTECDVYGKCGPFGRCNAVDSPICSCLSGFVPNNNTEWSDGNWSDGCVRRSSLHCDNVGGTSDGFSTLGSMKVPDDAVWSSAGNDDECRLQCLRKCSCLAYAYYSSIGCMMWNASLIDIVQLSDGIGVDLSVRLAYSDISDGTSDTKQGIVVLSGILGGSVVGALLLTAAGVMWRHRRYCDPLSCSVIHYFCFFMLLFGHIKQMSIVLEGMKCARAATTVLNEDQSESDFGDLPIFELHTLVTATNNFEESNKLGKGGFGSVYKGKLEDGVEVAVKRLSKVSGQGLTEFMTEVLVISKLQHRNLVRLLGCCVDGEEKLLVYEYMPNKSLDALLFDRLHQELLDWKTRFNIIQGICRGILYLHRDSRLKIIHRDLKAGNILLDDKLTPKIADFGMARIFVGKEDQADTNRVVGTYGYMSPEYAMEGRFSEKSDIFSLGVLLLEIISGRRNSSFRNEETLSLLAYAWKLWNEDNIVSLIDPTIFELGFQDEILRCTQIALLCLQELPEDRPDMSMVIYMIVDKASILSRPMQPGFTQRRHSPHYQTLEYENMSPSVNRVTLSSIGVR